jgi:hypothetical protein
MFVIVLIMSGIVGSLALINISLVTLAFGVIACFLTLLYALLVAPVLAVFIVLAGDRRKGKRLVPQAYYTYMASAKWTFHLILFMWRRLLGYLFKDDVAAQPHPGQAEQDDWADRYAAVLMLSATVVVDIVLIITLTNTL